jgi:hypothetical protein
MRLNPHQIQILVISVYLIIGLILAYNFIKDIDRDIEKGDENTIAEFEKVVEAAKPLGGNKFLIPFLLVFMAIFWLPFVVIFDLPDVFKKKKS